MITWLMLHWQRVAIGLAALVLLLTATFGLGYHSGWNAHKDADAKRQRAAAAKVQKREAVAEKITDRIADKTAAARVEIRYRTEYLTKEVPIYVTPADDARCVVPSGFVRLHDAAASSLPVAPGGPEQAPSDVPLSAVLETVIGNYGVGHDALTEAQAWREWYVEQKKAWDRK